MSQRYVGDFPGCSQTAHCTPVRRASHSLLAALAAPSTRAEAPSSTVARVTCCRAAHCAFCGAATTGLRTVRRAPRPRRVARPPSPCLPAPGLDEAAARCEQHSDWVLPHCLLSTLQAVPRLTDWRDVMQQNRSACAAEAQLRPGEVRRQCEVTPNVTCHGMRSAAHFRALSKKWC